MLRGPAPHMALVGPSTANAPASLGLGTAASMDGCQPGGNLPGVPKVRLGPEKVGNYQLLLGVSGRNGHDGVAQGCVGSV